MARKQTPAPAPKQEPAPATPAADAGPTPEASAAPAEPQTTTDYTRRAGGYVLTERGWVLAK